MFNKPAVNFFVSLMVIIAFPMNCIAGIIAFEMDDEIWIADMKGKNEKFICRGHDPSISPDGKFIAFTLDGSVGRRISIVDINTK